MLIVNSQVHIWKANSPDRPWTPGLEPQLPEPLSIEGLIDQMTGAGVDRVVIVPPHWEGLRNDYATEAFDRHPDRFRFMGRLDLERPDARAQLPGWMQQRGNLGMRQSFLSKHERDQLGERRLRLAVGGCRTISYPGDGPCGGPAADRRENPERGIRN